MNKTEKEEPIKRNPAWSDNYAAVIKTDMHPLDLIGKSIMETSIDELNLSVRTYNCCKRAGINTLGDLSMKTLDDMYHVRNLGRHSLQEIEKKMAEYGLRFKPVETKDD